MKLIGINHIDTFIKKHPSSRSSLKRWQKLITETEYENLHDLRKTFPHADYVDGKTVFNVGGNKVRAITRIQYEIVLVIITHILTHQEYDRNQWKD